MIKLQIASLWLPEFILIKEIDRVAKETTDCLDALLSLYAAEEFNALFEKKVKMRGNLEERRAIMAGNHNARVNLLIHALGSDKAVELGRRAMYKTGYELGRSVRRRLGVGDSLGDLIKAARVLYRVLGIEFKIENEKEKVLLTVRRCALASSYSPEACKILSAADEGTVHGLNENANMVFDERITQGAQKCTAHLKFVPLKK